MRLKIVSALLIAFTINIGSIEARRIDKDNSIENSCNAQAMVNDEVMSKLEEMSEHNNTIECVFIQEKIIKGLKDKHIMKGKFYLDNQGQMALVYDDANGDRVIMNDSKFTIHSNGKEISSAKNPMLKQLGILMQATMKGDVAMFKRGWEIIAGKSGKEYSLRLNPIDKMLKKYVNHMGLVFDKETMTLNMLMINMNNGGKTIYKFSDKKINEIINSNIFK